MTTIRRLAGQGRCSWCGRVRKRLFVYSTPQGIYSGRFCSAPCAEDYHSVALPRPIKDEDDRRG